MNILSLILLFACNNLGEKEAKIVTGDDNVIYYYFYYPEGDVRCHFDKNQIITCLDVIK